MLAIKDNYIDVDWKEIEEKHLGYCKELLESKIKNFNKNKKNKYYKTIYRYIKKVIQGTEDLNLNNVINCNPERFIEVNDIFNKKLDSLSDNKKYKNTIYHIFDYDYFSESTKIINRKLNWDAYHLSKKLNIGVCPYCNRQYTNTIIDYKEGKITDRYVRAEFDHFLSQQVYPLFRLSLYNLIPCCHICNKIKKDKETTNYRYIHPYIEGFGNSGKFSMDFLNSGILDHIPSLDSIQIKLITKGNYKDKIDNQNDLFKIEKIYDESHRDIIAELIAKKRLHPDGYLKAVQNIFREANLSMEELYRLAFGNYCSEKELGNRPLSKLTRDIALELGLIEEDFIK
ncbi:MAG: hypothetical protein P9M05_02975 [Candidatus Stygibacter australis]|nr:hypothetical protein [Candidatus Stygibacter australis]